jgi:uncharacterized protein (TIGR02145 family)
MLLISFSIAQETRLNFRSGNAGETIDSIIVLNQSSGQRLKLSGSETLILKNIPTIIPVMSMPDESGYLYPNPSEDFALMNYITNEAGRMELKLFNISGHLLGSYNSYLPQGMHQFRVTFPAHGFYINSVMQGHGIKNYKAISLEKKKQDFRVEYLGETNNIREYGLSTKSHTGEQLMDYREGDILQFAFYSGEKITVITGSPNATKEMVVDFYKCTDLDNRNYKTVKIGDQVWMAENLAYLPSVSPSADGSDEVPYYYVYDYQGTVVANAKQLNNYKTYGVLYNWPAAKAGAANTSDNSGKVQGVCPAGWHLPSDEEWTQLENFLRINGYNYDGSTSGNKIGKSMAASTNWETSSTIGAVSNNLSDNNKSGFSALPGGNRYHGNRGFLNIGYLGTWWNSTEINSSTPWYRQMVYSNVGVYRTDDARKSNGLSVRCVKDN